MTTKKDKYHVIIQAITGKTAQAESCGRD